MPDTLELANAVKDAIDKTSKEHGATITDDTEAAPDTKQTPPDDKQPADKTDKKEDTKAGELTEEQLKEATQLYSLLKDPEKGPGVVAWLAQQAGYTKAEAKVETKQDVKELKKDITATLKEKLGPELEFLADKLGPAVEEILKDQLAEHTQDLRASVQQQELDKLTQVSDNTYTALSKEFFGNDEPPQAVTTRINELIDEMPPKPGMTIDKYMKNLFNLAVGELGLQKASASNNNADKDRANRNRTDAAARLASDRASAPQQGVAVPTTKMSLTDAVTKAMQDVSKQQRGE